MKQRGKKKKELKEMRRTSETSGTMSNHRCPRGDKKKRYEKILEEIIVENLPKMGKEIATQVQETQRIPDRINPR